MTETRMTLAIKPLACRFAAPALAAWLLYMGVWIVIFSIEQPVMSLLTRAETWFVDHFIANIGLVETTSWSIRLFVQAMAEGIVLILLGLFVGLFIVRRKRQSLSHPG